MTRPSRRSLTTKIILECLVLLACLFTAVLAGGALYQRTIVGEMEAKSAQILHGLQVEIGRTGEPSADLLIQLREQQEVDSIVLFGPDEQFAAGAHSPRLAGSTVGDPGQGLQITRIEGAHGPLTAYMQTLPIEAADGGVLGYVKVTLALEPQTAILRAFRSKFLLALIAVFCLTTLALCHSVATAVRPLRHLSAHMQAVGEGTLEPVQVDATSREIGVLQERFNAMVAALEEKATMADRLRQTQRLSAMGNLAAGVAHDIGNPLNAVRLTASHLRDVVRSGDPDRLRDAERYVTTIGEEIDRLDGLVQNFLNLARDQEPRREPVAPDAVMQDVLRLVRAEARRRNIRLVETLDAPEVCVALDAGQMKGAVVNMLVNAFDAAGDGGEVELRTARHNGVVEIAVRDTGPGIPADVRQHMFDPYFTTKPDGTGLGLALSRTVVEQHGGSIDVASAPGGGTTFTIRLQAERPDA